MPSSPASAAAPKQTVSGWWLLGIAMALVAVLSSSVRPILIKLSYGLGAEPVTLLALRMVFSLPFFLAAALWSRRDAARTPISARDWALLAGLGVVGHYAASFLDFLGLQYVSAGVGRLLLFLYPTVVVLLSWAFLRKRIGPREIGALLLTYAGVAMVVSRGLAGANADLPLGAALVFGSAVCYAVYLVAGSQVIRRVGSVRFTAYATMVACFACIAQFAAVRPLSALDLPLEVYGLAFAMAALCTVLPIFLTAEALRRIGANHVALLGALGPVSAIGLGWLGLEEVLTGVQVLGAVLVLAGVMLVTVGRPAARPR
ncbi:DMT family transporter [Arenibaculum sp.]|uniref:DMT family transporter n=1 Tax=Arenibaculum sp. TaxID=2865862 RepID=UPI002E0F1F3E|nr:DMT family transporter [Arenibaculum sp.]